jgi:hypothetical protein
LNFRISVISLEKNLVDQSKQTLPAKFDFYIAIRDLVEGLTAHDNKNNKFGASLLINLAMLKAQV